MRFPRNTLQSPGFTLLELVIVLAVMTILSGILIPIVKQIIDNSKVAKVLGLIDSLTSACKRYHMDTAQFATEDGSSTLPAAHTLSYNPNVDPENPVAAGWDGPYIDGPLLNAQLPFTGATIRLLPSVGSTFLLSGWGGPGTTSPQGNEIELLGIPMGWAIRIDELIDGPDQPRPAEAGRVRYGAASGAGDANLNVFVLEPSGIPK